MTQQQIDQIMNKLNSLESKLDEHMDEVQPFLLGWKGAKLIGNGLKWTAGVTIAIGALIASIKIGLK